MRLPHNNPQESVAGPNQRNLKRNRSLPNVSGIEKSSAGLTRSLWVLKGTKKKRVERQKKALKRFEKLLKP